MNRTVKLLALGAATMLALATQLPHPQGAANIYRALQRLGIEQPGLNYESIDNWVGGGLLLALAALIFAVTFWPSPKPVAVPVPAAARPRVPSEPGLPDMPIRDLFRLLVPGLDESTEQRPRAEAAGVLIRNSLARGDLTAWGKPDNGGRQLRLITAAYWQRAEWTFWFLPADPHNVDLIHATQPDGSAPMRDLHVNRAAAQAVLG